MTRRYIKDGSLPPYDAVRVEEFVNSFDQGYAAPRDAAFTIYADGAPAPQGFDEGTYILRFGVQGYRVDDYERKPSVLTFVIDVSGSMGMENRLELVKRSLRLLVDRLDERDSVAIVVYGTQARAVLKPTSGSRHGVIIDAIDRLQPEGSTNAEAGLRLGYRYAQRLLQEGANNRVILCSDGVANVGNTDADTILYEVQRSVDSGINLTTVGFGMGNFNDVLLEQLADRGNGNYAYVDTLDEARKLFVDNLTSTLQVIAQDAKVQVDFNSEVVRATACWATRTAPSPTRTSATTAWTPAKWAQATPPPRCTPCSSSREPRDASPPSSCAGRTRKRRKRRDQRQLQHLGPGRPLRRKRSALPARRDRGPVCRNPARKPLYSRLHCMISPAVPTTSPARCGKTMRSASLPTWSTGPRQSAGKRNNFK